MKELAIFVDTSLPVPAYEQIYSFIKKEIISGRLSKGTKLPSTRELADYMQFSRSTILMAYEQLIAEGYIESRTRRGYFVTEVEKGFDVRDVKSPQEKRESRQAGYETDFSPDGIEEDFFPYNEWRRLGHQVVVSENSELFNSGDPKGDIGLRMQIAQYLGESRGVRTDADHIVLGAGNENILTIISMLVGKALFAMENPVYGKSYRIIKNLGHDVRMVGIDESGIDVKELEGTAADAVYVTPSHQYPLGTIMSISRRLELIDWACREEGRYIIEDDYDSEFRYRGKPIPSLQGNDRNGKVIYIGTFSKSISPALRISYMVIPEGLYEKYEELSSFMGNTVSRIDQKTVELFMKTGGFERHLNRMRKIYKNKHEVMLAELKKWSRTTVSGENAGVHMLVHIDNGKSEKELVELAGKAGIRVYPLSAYYKGPADYKIPTVILGYARLSPEQIENGLTKLKKVWKI